MARTDVHQWDGDPKRITAPITTFGRTAKPTDVALSLREVMAAVYRYIGSTGANDGDYLVYDAATKSIKAATGPAASVQSVDGRTGAVTLSDLYLGINAKAADSNLLDGLDSSSFINTSGGQTINGPLTLAGRMTAVNMSVIGVGSDQSYIDFFKTDGTTRIGRVGFTDSSTNHMYLSSEIAADTIVVLTKDSSGISRYVMRAGGPTPYASLYYGGAEKFKTINNGVQIIGHAYPNSDNTYDLGASTLQYRSAFVTNYHVNAANGSGIKFWRSDSYKIYMAADTYTGLGSPTETDSSPDYNLYFRMTNGAARGWVFYNDSASATPAMQITGVGNAYLRGDGRANDWIATSDRRIKSNIERIDRALARLRSVTGCTFDKKGANYRMAGVIAQDVEEALPEAVVDGKVKAVSAQAMIGLLVEAVKELEQRVEALQ